jgi:UPF0755 protein
MRLLLLAIVIAAALGGGAWLEYSRFASTPIHLDTQSVVVEIPRGISLRELSQKLAARRIVSNAYLFIALGRITGDGSRIEAGEYSVRTGITPRQLIALFASGKVMQHAVTIIEGWTFRQAFAAIETDDRFVKELEGVFCDELMARLGYPGQKPEGRFFPDTYYFTKGTTDIEILRRAHRTMTRILKEEWAGRAPGLPLSSPGDALILASIIERETGLRSERPRVAGVFERRLALGMRLQADPTVIYGLGNAYDGELTKADLAEDSPYNTYLHAGLPPTPIALPSRASIHAAVHPAPGDSLYFVARGNGTHQFSATLEEHNAAVRRYQLGTR